MNKVRSCSVVDCKSPLRSNGRCRYHAQQEWHKAHPLHRTWSNIKARCYDSNCDSYKNYGARGITVCDRWLESYDNFAEDMGERPAGHSIERVDNEKGYSPDNCRWASIHEQQGNTRRNNSTVGVRFNRLRKKWIAYLTVNKVSFERNFYTEPEAIAYRRELELTYLDRSET